MEIVKEGSFVLNTVEAKEIRWAECSDNSSSSNYAYYMAKCMRSVAEPLLVEQFGEVVIDELFKKYKRILSHRLYHEDDNKSVIVVVSMTRRD
ncbi:UNVERIFIED_CONTAM: Salicylate carboxymethyltransferase [Sesamum calycinum]